MKCFRGKPILKMVNFVRISIIQNLIVQLFVLLRQFCNPWGVLYQSPTNCAPGWVLRPLEDECQNALVDWHTSAIFPVLPTFLPNKLDDRLRTEASLAAWWGFVCHFRLGNELDQIYLDPPNVLDHGAMPSGL